MDEQMQLQIVQLVQAAMSGDQLATQQVQQIMLAAKLGDQQAVQIAQMILQVALQMQQSQAQMAKFGAKLNYIKYLNGKCPDGYEMKMFRKGGTLCKKCMKKHKPGGEIEIGEEEPPLRKPKNPVDDFKMKHKAKKDKCGGKVKKKK